MSTEMKIARGYSVQARQTRFSRNRVTANFPAQNARGRDEGFTFFSDYNVDGR